KVGPRLRSVGGLVVLVLVLDGGELAGGEVGLDRRLGGGDGVGGVHAVVEDVLPQGGGVLLEGGGHGAGPDVPVEVLGQRGELRILRDVAVLRQRCVHRVHVVVQAQRLEVLLAGQEELQEVLGDGLRGVVGVL